MYYKVGFHEVFRVFQGNAFGQFVIMEEPNAPRAYDLEQEACLEFLVESTAEGGDYGPIGGRNPVVNSYDALLDPLLRPIVVLAEVYFTHFGYRPSG